jgi:integrase
MTASGIAQMVGKRCREAGIEPINVHRFRHTWAHQMKARRATDETLRTICG